MKPAEVRSKEARRGRAIRLLREMRETHVHWADYLRGGGELEHEMIGDLAHHEECIRGYDEILKFVRTA